MIGRPDTLFGRTAAILLTVFLFAQGAALYAVWLTVIVPLAERAADDLAARMLLAAQTWVELPPETRPDYEIELFLQHNLELGRVDAELPARLPASYFSDRLGEALSQRAGQPIRLKEGPDPAWAWAEIRLSGHLLRVGLLRDRYELAAPWEAGAVFLAGAMLTLAAALLLAGRTASRLRLLARSAAEVGQGRLPERLPETGADELKALTAAFNRMADEVQSLLENRTVLLSGLSHDLRTPITRMQLALAMLDTADPALVTRMEHDLSDMNRLISQMLDFARALKSEEASELDLHEALSAIASSSSHPERVQLTGGPPCRHVLCRMALNRVVGNLLENALRYGNGLPVELAWSCGVDALRVVVLDRGAGIPEAERDNVFQPFYRLEGSRSRETGGSGLGLAIVRQLADAQGWQVTLDARDGGGLVAALSIPVRA